MGCIQRGFRGNFVDLRGGAFFPGSTSPVLSAFPAIRPGACFGNAASDVLSRSKPRHFGVDISFGNAAPYVLCKLRRSGARSGHAPHMHCVNRARRFGVSFGHAAGASDVLPKPRAILVSLSGICMRPHMCCANRAVAGPVLGIRHQMHCAIRAVLVSLSGMRPRAQMYCLDCAVT